LDPWREPPLLAYGLASCIITAFAKCLLATFGAALLGCWIPVGIYYESQRFRWVYIVLYYLAVTLLALLIGYSIAMR